MRIIGKTDPQPQATRRPLSEVGDLNRCDHRIWKPLRQSLIQEYRIGFIERSRKFNLLIVFNHSSALDTDERRQSFPLRRGIPEQQLRGLGTFEVQVCRVLPGEPDPAVNLDVLRGHPRVGR